MWLSLPEFHKIIEEYDLADNNLKKLFEQIEKLQLRYNRQIEQRDAIKERQQREADAIIQISRILIIDDKDVDALIHLADRRFEGRVEILP